MAQERKQRMIIISLDAVGTKDIPYLKTLPNFKKLFEKSAYCMNVESVYPSLTYPAHTSIITGCTPNHHGVINNTCFQINRKSPDWMWQRRFVKKMTLYDELLKQKKKVAAVLWPVTAQSKITYNVPEVFANRPWQNQIMVSAANGSVWYELELNKKFGKMRNGVSQPALDNFAHASVVHTIEKYNPDLILVHFTDVDTHRHLYGVNHKKVTEALNRHDKRLGEIMEMLEKTGDADKTTVVILGDHYQMDAKRIVYLNYMLKERGFLTVKNGKITDYDFVARNCDGSCYIYKNPKKKLSVDRISELEVTLKECEKEDVYGIERIYTGKEAGELGADDRCLYMIEACQGVYYLDEFEMLTKGCENSKMKATHGYLPTKPDYQTFFMVSGYGINPGVEVPYMRLYDEGPTLARIWNVTLPEADGRVIEEILV